MIDKVGDKKIFLEILEQSAFVPFQNSFISKIPTHPDKAVIPHIHPYFRLIFTVTGCYRFKYWNNGFIEGNLHPGETLATLPGGVLANLHTPPCRIFTLVLWKNTIRCLLTDKTGDNYNQLYIHTSNPISPFGRLQMEVICQLPTSFEYDGIRTRLLHSLLEICLLEIRNDTPSTLGKAFHSYQNALTFINENIHSPTDRTIVAKNMNITPSHVSKLFRKFAGKDFKSVVKDMRMERALLLMKNTNLTIKETAHMCGFKTATHFIKTFKAIYGSSPDIYRRSIQEKQGK